MFGHLTLNDRNDITLVREIFHKFNVTLTYTRKKEIIKILLHFPDIRKAVDGLIVHNIPFSLEVK